MSVYRGIIALAVALLLAGCSSVQLAYNKAPLLLQYQMDNYLDLTAEQEDVLRQELLTFQAWHRREALPQYASTLREWSEGLAEPHTFTAAEVLEKQAVFQDAMLSMAQQSALRLAPLLLTLTPEQQKRLESRFEKSNREYAKDHLRNPAQSEGQRRERFAERFENWLGPLSAPQKTTLDQWLASNPSGAALWSKERQARQQALLALMAQARTQPSAEQAAESLHDYFQSLANYRVSELQSQRPERQQSLATLTADLLNQMNDRQRQHLRKKLQSYAQDFDELADRG
jgi:hypothetical protein